MKYELYGVEIEIMKYELYARNVSGAGVTFIADTIKEVLNKFDTIYSRKGFVIWINKYNGNAYVEHKLIKSSHR